MRTFLKALIITPGLASVALIVVVIVSPYGKKEGFNYRLISHTIEIDVPADSVFRFLGNSANAHRWSVFVDHISPLNSDEVKDGTPGSKRRCFRNADETGIIWDETLTEVIPAKKRQIICYDLKEFEMNVDDIATEQLYESLPNGKCTLTFTFFQKKDNPGFIETLKLHIGSFKLYGIFKRNMENIKAICEGKAPLHKWE